MNKLQRVDIENDFDKSIGLYVIKKRRNFFILNVIKINNKEYSMYVVCQPKDFTTTPNLDLIYESACLLVNVNTEKKTAVMEQLECSIWSLEKVSEDMVNATLYSCIFFFDIETIYFVDKSSISMQAFNFLVYGISWYERKFGAILLTIDDFNTWYRSRTNRYRIIDEEETQKTLRHLKLHKYEYYESFKNILEEYRNKQWGDLFEHLYFDIEKLNKSESMFTKIFVDFMAYHLGFISLKNWKIKTRYNDNSDTIIFKTNA